MANQPDLTQWAAGPAKMAVTVREAAMMVSLGEPKVREAIYRGDLPAVRDGKRIIIMISDLQEWLSALPDATEPWPPR